jgi:hypothetical protein
MDELSLGLSNWGSLSQPQDNNNTLTNDESNSLHNTSPQLVHQSSRTSIYRFQDKGFKILLGENLGDPQPHQWQISQLQHEQNVSLSLPFHCRRREVLNIRPFNGHPIALYFKWSNGITLTEWMQKVQSGTNACTELITYPHNTTYNRRISSSYSDSTSYASNSTRNSSFYSAAPAVPPHRTTDDLNVRLRAAMAVTKTLSEFHEGGVAHGNLTPENIVLDTFEGDYVATLIDLSESVVFREVNLEGGENKALFEKQKKQEDLKALGGVLKQLFRGFDDVNDRNSFQIATYDSYGASAAISYGTSTALTLGDGGDSPFETWGDETRRKRNKAPAIEVGDGLPIYLGSLISTLLLTGNSTTSNSPASTVHYESAKDVFLDLKVMLEDQNQFYRQTELDERMMGSRLWLPSMFYGRQVQMSMLMHLFQNVIMFGSEPAIATISG